MSQIINPAITIRSSNAAKNLDNGNEYIDQLEDIVQSCVTKLETAINRCSNNTNELSYKKTLAIFLRLHLKLL